MLSVAAATLTATAPLSFTTLKTFLLAFDIIILDIQVHRDNYYDVTKRGPKKHFLRYCKTQWSNRKLSPQKESYFVDCKRLKYFFDNSWCFGWLYLLSDATNYSNVWMVVYVQSLVKCFFRFGTYGLQLLNDLIKRNYLFGTFFIKNNPNHYLQTKK